MALTILGAGEKLPVAVPRNLRYGDGRLVIWGMRSLDAYWHIARRSSWAPIQDGSGTGLAPARSLCGQFIMVNGEPGDYLLPGAKCPACMERL